jgi:hypothetical protein
MKTLICTLLFSVLAFAADVTGQYSGTYTATGADGQPRDSGVLVMLKQTGTQITGSGGPDESRQYPIRNGKIAGNTVTGEAVNPDGPVYKLTLTVTGDKMTGSIEINMPDGQKGQAKLNAMRIK